MEELLAPFLPEGFTVKIGAPVALVSESIRLYFLNEFDNFFYVLRDPQCYVWQVHLSKSENERDGRINFSYILTLREMRSVKKLCSYLFASWIGCSPISFDLLIILSSTSVTPIKWRTGMLK